MSKYEWNDPTNRFYRGQYATGAGRSQYAQGNATTKRLGEAVRQHEKTFSKRPALMILGPIQWQLMVNDYPAAADQTMVMLDMQDGQPGITIFPGNADSRTVITSCEIKPHLFNQKYLDNNSTDTNIN